MGYLRQIAFINQKSISVNCFIKIQKLNLKHMYFIFVFREFITEYH